MSTFEEDEYGILKSGSAYYLPGRDIPYSTQKAALAAENERLTTRVNALEAALEATTTAMLEWEEDLSPTNQRAKLALIAEARSALTRDTGALDTPSPRLPGGTRVRLADTGQTGHLAPYSPGDGDRYTVVLDAKDNTGSRNPAGADDPARAIRGHPTGAERTDQYDCLYRPGGRGKPPETRAEARSGR